MMRVQAWMWSRKVVGVYLGGKQVGEIFGMGGLGGMFWKAATARHPLGGVWAK